MVLDHVLTAVKMGIAWMDPEDDSVAVEPLDIFTTRVYFLGETGKYFSEKIIEERGTRFEQIAFGVGMAIGVMKHPRLLYSMVSGPKELNYTERHK